MVWNVIPTLAYFPAGSRYFYLVILAFFLVLSLAGGVLTFLFTRRSRNRGANDH